MNSIKLVLIDEVHLLNDEKRGPVLEAIVSRMKAFQQGCNGNAAGNSDAISKFNQKSARFVVLSATIPNIGDIAQWLNGPVKAFRLDSFERLENIAWYC